MSALPRVPRGTNGKPRTLACRTHKDKRVVIYGAPSAQAWCICGREFITVRNQLRKADA